MSTDATALDPAADDTLASFWQRIPFAVTPDGVRRIIFVASRELVLAGESIDGFKCLAHPPIVRGELGLATPCDGGYRVGDVTYCPLSPLDAWPFLLERFEREREQRLAEPAARLRFLHAVMRVTRANVADGGKIPHVV